MHVDEFFRSLVGTVKPGEALAVCSDNFIMQPWEPDQVHDGPEKTYFCISTVRRANRRQRRVFRSAADLVRCFVIVLDDIGSKIPIERITVMPTYILETSPGNFQYFYKITGGMEPGEATALIAALIEAGYSDPGATAANHVFRFPGSVNRKPALSEPFAARLTHARPDREWTRARLTAAFGVTVGDYNVPQDVTPLEDGEICPVQEWLEANHEVAGYTGEARRGWYTITCPRHDLHTPTGRADNHQAGWHPGKPGGFHCFHDSCKMTTRLFKDWIYEQDPQASGDIRSGLDIEDKARRVGERLAQATAATAAVANDEPMPGQRRLFEAANARVYVDSESRPALRLARHIHAFRLGAGILPSPKLTAAGNVSLTQPTTDANVAAVMQAIGFEARLNVMTWDAEVTLAGYDREETLEDHLSNLVHACTRCGMSGAAEPVWQAAERYAASKRYHPALDWINQCEEWDGVDRIEQLANTLIMRDAKLIPWRNIVVRRWLIQGMYAITNWQRPAPVDVGYCLVLQGKQGRNKSKWMKNALLPQQFVTGDITLKLSNSNERDAVTRATTTPITELAELNATFGKSDIAGLRNFLTALEDVYRHPWGRRPAKRPRVTMFGATVNPRLFLIDVTGERRFWTLAIERCVWNHRIDLQQLWCQVACLYDDGEQYWLTDGEAALHRRISREHQVDSDVHDIVNDLEHRALAQPRDHTWVHVTAKELLERNGVTPARSFAARQDLNAMLDETDWAVEAKTNGKRGWWVPNTRTPLTTGQREGLRLIKGDKDEKA